VYIDAKMNSALFPQRDAKRLVAYLTDSPLAHPLRLTGAVACLLPGRQSLSSALAGNCPLPLYTSEVVMMMMMMMMMMVMML